MQEDAKVMHLSQHTRESCGQPLPKKGQTGTQSETQIFIFNLIHTQMYLHSLYVESTPY